MNEYEKGVRVYEVGWKGSIEEGFVREGKGRELNKRGKIVWEGEYVNGKRLREMKKQSCHRGYCFIRVIAIFIDLGAIFIQFAIICDIPIGAVYISSGIGNVDTFPPTIHLFSPPFYDYYKSGPNSTTEHAILLGRLY